MQLSATFSRHNTAQHKVGTYPDGWIPALKLLHRHMILIGDGLAEVSRLDEVEVVAAGCDSWLLRLRSIGSRLRRRDGRCRSAGNTDTNEVAGPQ